MSRVHLASGVVIASALLGSTAAWGCGWWDCRDGYRPSARVYGYSSGVTGRAAVNRRAVGVEAPNAGTFYSGLQAPAYTSAAGIMASPMPARGPTLFGPAPPVTYGYSPPRQRSYQRRRAGPPTR